MSLKVLKFNCISVTQDTVDDSSRLVRFAESPIMSTYLVAIVVGEFEASEAKTKDNITVGGTIGQNQVIKLMAHPVFRF